MKQHVDKGRVVNVETDLDEHEEIKITPEMIEAGSREFSIFAEYPADNRSLAAVKIFLAMLAASR